MVTPSGWVSPTHPRQPSVGISTLMFVVRILCLLLTFFVVRETQEEVVAALGWVGACAIWLQQSLEVILESIKFLINSQHSFLEKLVSFNVLAHVKGVSWFQIKRWWWRCLREREKKDGGKTGQLKGKERKRERQRERRETETNGDRVGERKGQTERQSKDKAYTCSVCTVLTGAAISISIVSPFSPLGP